MDKKHQQLAIFQDKSIRRVWNESEWWFVLEDVVVALIESKDVKQYIQKMRKRDPELEKGWVQIVHTLDIETHGGIQKMNCSNTEGLFRIIQSITSPKAEPFKLWLAKVGYERVKEIENPELAQERMKVLYEQKGYSKSWIDKRLRGIAIRQDLTDEWKERGIESQHDYAILTAEISKATFGMTPTEYKNFKNIPAKSKANLRDNMTDLELIFTMLGEKVSTEISENEKPKGMPENKKVARRGGNVAGNARKETEKELGRTVVEKKNYLDGGDVGQKILKGKTLQ